MDALRVRVYNVRFGDAILISVPDTPPGGSPKLRHILVDVGNSLGTEGGLDAVFEPVLQDVLTELAGQPLDLYVMTHEHLDHVQGLQYYQKKVLKDKLVKDLLQVRCAWLTRSAHPNYYKPKTDEYHENAKKRMDMAEAFLDEAVQYFRAAPDEETGWIQGLMAINNPRATKDCVDLIRELAPGNTHYVYRGFDVAGKHPFQEATFEIWAPEEDTSTYYGPFQPVAFGAAPGATVQARPTLTPLRAKPTLTPVEPPRGVDTGAFYNLVDMRRWGYGDNLLAIDSAANNTSIVFCLNWRGWSLLFPGDAEERSWKEMDKRDLLKPVHFFKISHHGSITGMLPDDLVDKVLKDDGTRRYAALSAYPDLDKPIAVPEKKKEPKKGKKEPKEEPQEGEQSWTYTEVPRREVLAKLAEYADLQQTVKVPPGGYIEYAFEGGTRNVTITLSK